MSNPFVLIQDDDIIFNTSHRYVNTHLSFGIPLPYFLSTFGFIIPLNTQSIFPFEICGKMLGRPHINRTIIDASKNNIKTVKNLQSMIIDQNGSCFVGDCFSIDDYENGPSFIPGIVPIGRDIKHITSLNIEHCDVGMSALECTNTIEEAFRIIIQTVPTLREDGYRLFRISEIGAWVARCLEEKAPLPFKGSMDKLL